MDKQKSENFGTAARRYKMLLNKRKSREFVENVSRKDQNKSKPGRDIKE